MKYVLGVLAVALSVAPAAAQQCGPSLVSFGWTQPQNLPITDPDAQRWPLDATIRVAFGGDWCPDESTIKVEQFDDDVVTPVPAQVRVSSPAALVENSAQPLTVIEIDPIDDLEERSDYRVVLSPPNPSLAVYEDYTIQFRTRSGPGDAFPDFEGILAVETDGDRCDNPSYYEAIDANNPACLVSTKLRLNVIYQPVDRGEVSYIVYRTSTTPLDANGDEVLAEADRTAIPVAIEAGSRDVLGTGLSPRRVRVFVLYAPLPRRDCYAVRALDEWGRERGDLEATACIDLLPLAPCPDGCVDDQCQVGFPEPNPFETNEPILGQDCENLGLNGAPADRPVPPVETGAGGGGGEGGGTGDAGPGDGGAGADGGASEDDGGSGGCTASGAPGPAWGWLLLLVCFRRRR